MLANQYRELAAMLPADAAPLPLVVNTMGWVSGHGLELLFELTPSVRQQTMSRHTHISLYLFWMPLAYRWGIQVIYTEPLMCR